MGLGSVVGGATKKRASLLSLPQKKAPRAWQNLGTKTGLSPLGRLTRDQPQGCLGLFEPLWPASNTVLFLAAMTLPATLLFISIRFQLTAVLEYAYSPATALSTPTQVSKLVGPSSNFLTQAQSAIVAWLTNYDLTKHCMEHHGRVICLPQSNVD